jgi:hypothetical protein
MIQDQKPSTKYKTIIIEMIKQIDNDWILYKIMTFIKSWTT